jgi:hypothetical protein
MQIPGTIRLKFEDEQLIVPVLGSGFEETGVPFFERETKLMYVQLNLKYFVVKV